jgi:hypothetical protein
MVKAYEKKANLLQSKGAKMRTEIRAQGMTTRSEEKQGWDLSGKGSDKDYDPADDNEDLPNGSGRPTADDAVARMQEINKNKNKRSKRPSSKTNKAKAKKQRRQ